ncbi:MAG: hypothetical protein U0836_12100 [Pirellulales bacterium]
MPSSDNQNELIEFLRGAGHSPADIEKIMARLERYDFETQHDSIMDSIGSGSIDLAAIIKEALGESE